MSKELTIEEKEMTKRQKLIAGWDQNALKNACVFIAGVGALGCEIGKDLALCGVGKLILCDLDTIETSNLSRQMLFYKGDEGQPKAKVAAERLKKMNPYCEIEWYHKPIQDLPMSLYKSCDVIIAALDNVKARMDLNTYCIKLGKPMIEGGTVGMEGHVQVIVPETTRDVNGNPIEYGNPDEIAEGIAAENLMTLDETEYADYYAAQQKITELEEEIERIKEASIYPVEEAVKQKALDEVMQNQEKYLNHTPCYRCAVPVPPPAGQGVAACTLKGVPRTRDQCVIRGEVLFQKETNKPANLDSFDDMKKVWEFASKELVGLRERVLAENIVEGETTPEEIESIKTNLVKTFPDLEIADMENILGNKIPAVQTVSAIIASLESQEALKLIFLMKGRTVGSVMSPPYVNYNGVFGQFDAVPMQRREDCVACGSRVGQENINIIVDKDATVGDLFFALQQAKLNVKLGEWIIINPNNKSFVYNPKFEKGKTENQKLTEFGVGELNELTFTMLGQTAKEGEICQYNVIINYPKEA